MQGEIMTASAGSNLYTPPADFYRDGGKPNVVMTGGGRITYDTALNLKWEARFIVIGGGASTNGNVYSTSGYYDINMPAVGTVIPALGNATAVTVTAEGIPMAQWGALYYKLSGGGNGSVDTNFIYVGYSGGNYQVTPDMVLVAAHNSDTNPKHVKLGTGQIVTAGTRSSYSMALIGDRPDAGLSGTSGAQSGFFETNAPAPAANWPVGVTGWQHLIDVRHSNPGNNYALQISGPFSDQWFYGRKTNNNAAAPWQTFLMQYVNGDVTLKSAPRNYTTTALAIADTTLPAKTMYTVTVAGAKQLYVK